MRILLVEGQAGEGKGAEEVLRASGHDVQRCVDEHADSFPCNGMISGSCPLEEGEVGAAVLVRTDIADTRSAREDGVRCALRRHVPLVLAGDASTSPYASWAAEVSEVHDLPAALERAANSVLVRHEDVARRSLAAVLLAHELDPAGAAAEVRRQPDGHLKVRLRLPAEVPPRVAEMAAVRASGAIRDLDPYAAKIDVTVDW
jgi:hypothetical protein